MKTIWKYQLPIADSVTLVMPKGAKVLSVVSQRDVPTLYAEVDTEQTIMEDRIAIIRGTGHDLAGTAAATFIGTVPTQNANFVWHIFVR